MFWMETGGVVGITKLLGLCRASNQKTDFTEENAPSHLGGRAESAAPQPLSALVLGGPNLSLATYTAAGLKAGVFLKPQWLNDLQPCLSDDLALLKSPFSS